MQFPASARLVHCWRVRFATESISKISAKTGRGGVRARPRPAGGTQDGYRAADFRRGLPQVCRHKRARRVASARPAIMLGRRRAPQQ